MSMSAAAVLLRPQASLPPGLLVGLRSDPRLRPRRCWHPPQRLSPCLHTKRPETHAGSENARTCPKPRVFRMRFGLLLGQSPPPLSGTARGPEATDVTSCRSCTSVTEHLACAELWGQERCVSGCCPTDSGCPHHCSGPSRWARVPAPSTSPPAEKVPVFFRFRFQRSYVSSSFRSPGEGKLPLLCCVASHSRLQSCPRKSVSPRM